MVKYEVLNILENVNGKWSYTAQIIDSLKKTQVSGTVNSYKTNSQIKNAIRTQMEWEIQKYQGTLIPEKTKALTTDSVFKTKLSVMAEI